MPKLIVQLGGQEWTVDLQPGANVVGRQSTCSIPLKEPSLSRQHCEIVVAGPKVTLVDKGSMNGTLVNGKKVASQVLAPGDRISLGQAVLWFEKKNVAVESRPPASAPAPDPSVQSQAATRRSLAALAPAPAAPAVPAPVSDFAVLVRSGGAGLKIAGWALLAAVLGAAVYFGAGLLKSDGPSVVEDRDNLLGRNSGFDRSAGGKPEGWLFREKVASALGVDPAQGRGGGPCMVLEKSAADLVVEAASTEEFALANASLVEGEVQVRFENFAGWAAVKVDWLREAKGPVVAEEYSDLAPRCAQWTALRFSSPPPAGCRAFRMGLVAIGRGGRIFFDDVSLKRRPGAGAGPEHKLGSHVVRATRQGVVQIGLKGRQALSSVGVRLESEKEGAIPQASAFQVSLTPQEDVLIFTGKMLNPVDFREVEFEEQIAAVEGATETAWRFKGAELRLVDRVAVQINLPQVDSIQGLPESPDQPVYRLAFIANEGDFVIETNEPVRVREQQAQGRRRLLLGFRVDPQAEEPVFGFSVRSASGEAADPEKAAQSAEAARRHGQALAGLRDFLPRIRDAAQKERVENRIQSLEQAERRDWADVQALAFQAELSGRPELAKRAQDAVEGFLAQWRGAGIEGKAQKLREALPRPAGGDAEEERAGKILELAKQCAEGGKRSVAEAMLKTLLAKYPSSDAAPEARQLLGSLSP